jgi:hypothetical protein
VTFSTLSISKHPQHLQGIERKVVVLLEGRERGDGDYMYTRRISAAHRVHGED